MKNNERVWLWGIIGFLLGVVATIFFASNAVNNNMTGMMRMMGMRTGNMIQERNDNTMMKNDHDESMSMQGMINELKGKTGDDFDSAFIKLMIDHHQGAIDMAKLAQQYAKHDEIKSLADDITTTQTKEIDMMKEWQKTWGY